MTISLLGRDELNEALQQQITALYHQLNDRLEQLPLTALLNDKKSLIFAIGMDEDKVAGIALMATYKVISGHKGMIEDVVVDRNYRGKGTGRKLMEKLLEEAGNIGLDEVLLFSGHHRTAAINLYKSLGFQLKESGLYRLPLR